ncbi:MAG: anthranilate synthase component I family protein [Planctomycetota bacterium]
MIERTLSTTLEPAAMFAALRPCGLPFLLDNAAARDSKALSILGVDPISYLEWHRGEGQLVWGATRESIGDLNQALRRLRGVVDVPAGDLGDLPFQGGLLGYLGYDAGRAYEPMPDENPADSSLPDLWFGAYDLFLVRQCDKWRLVCVSEANPENSERIERVVDCVRVADGDLQTANQDASVAPKRRPAVSSVSASGHQSRVEAVRELIRQGDVYQINLTQRWLVPCKDDAARLFSRLQREHPAPYGALFEWQGAAIVSVSPESYLKLDQDQVESRPIKGTSPRYADPDLDARSAKELLVSEKDRAELAMIVDLIRNDLSRVCRPGSVVVSDHAHLESAPTVHHLVTVVRGKLREGCDLFDLLKASFPGGSITGAPKIRAMQRIDEIESLRRGIYTGSIGYVSACGKAEFSIAIRTVVLEGGFARVYGGGGVVIDSDPKSEYDESVAKVSGILEILGAEIRHEGISSEWPLRRGR